MGNLSTDLLGDLGGGTSKYFVQPQGNGLDGKSWYSAFTTIQAAYSAIQALTGTADASENNIIYVAPGSYDLVTDGTYALGRQVSIIGVGMTRHAVIIANTGAGGAVVSIMNASMAIHLENLTIDSGATDDDGVILAAGSDGSVIKNVQFDAASNNAAHDAIRIEGSTGQCIIEDVEILGTVANCTGINLNTAPTNQFKNCYIYNSLVGVHLQDTTDERNVFTGLTLDSCAKGIWLASGADNNRFIDTTFIGTFSTQRVDDDATEGTNDFIGITLDNPATTMYPDNVAGGIVVTAQAGANNYTAAPADIVVAGAIDAPVIVKGIYLDVPAAAEVYFIRILWATTVIGETQFNTSAATDLHSYVPLNNDFVVPSGGAIKCAVKSVTGGNTIVVWAQLVQI